MTDQIANSSTMTLKAWREQMGFSQREAAEKLGCSRSSIAGYESGDVEIYLARLRSAGAEHQDRRRRGCCDRRRSLSTTEIPT
jgi:DNA-binding XRE family transcriptional regulator